MCTSSEIVEDVELSSACSVSCWCSGRRHARQPPFRRNLFHSETATPAAIAVQNSPIVSLCAPALIYQLARIMMGRVTRDSLRMRWNRTGA